MKFRMTRHAVEQAELKGFAVDEVLAAAENPSTRYANGRYAGQWRHIRGDLCVVVSDDGAIITLYRNVVETDLRADQTDRDARRYAAKRRSKAA